MKKGLFIFLILCFSHTIISCVEKEESSDSSSSLASCSGRGCNKPAPYSKMTLGNSESSLKYFITPSFSEIGENAVKSGINLAKNFLGTAYPVRIYLLAPNKAITEYSGFSSDWCTFSGLSSNNCGDSQISTAQNGGGQYFASGIDSCESCGNTNSGAGLFILPRDQDMKSNLAYRGIHEYTHTVQKVFGDTIPTWLMEGGAVYMECVMAQQVDNNTFSQCFKTGGGGGGVINNVRTLYGDNSKTTWLKTYGTDSCCDKYCPSGIHTDEPLSDTNKRSVYYDVGAMAVAFAINKANAYHQNDGGRTSKDFWQSKVKGFWHAIIPYGDIDLTNGYPSSVPEGKGWKAALTTFTGYKTVDEFYDAFEAFVMPNGVVASEDVLLSILESDSEVYTMSQQIVDSSSTDFINNGQSCGN